MGSSLKKQQKGSVLSKKNKGSEKVTKEDAEIKRSATLHTKESGTMTDPEKHNEIPNKENRLKCTYVKPQNPQDEAYSTC